MSLYRPYVPLVAVLTFLCIAVVLLAVNQVTLGEASFTESGKARLSSRVLSSNRIHVVALLALVLVLSAGWRVLNWLSHWLSTLIPAHQGPPQTPKVNTPTPKLPTIGQVAHPTPVSHVLSVILQVFGIVVLCVVGGWIAYQLGKVVVRAVARWLRVFGGRIEGHEDLEYVDHVESLDTPSLRDRLALRRMRRTKRPERWNGDWDERTKARYIYRTMIAKAVAKGFPWSSAATPEETMTQLATFIEQTQVSAQLDDFVRLYNRARYSSDDLAKDEAGPARETLIETRWTLKS